MDSLLMREQVKKKCDATEMNQLEKQQEDDLLNSEPQ